LADTFRIEFAREAANDLRELRAFDKRKVLDAIQLFLIRDPRKTSRSRIKLMAQPFWSQYRLRVEQFRVYYDLDEVAGIVNVVRVLRKTTDPTQRQPP
jgi:mRNA interferase RelE/StbE